jgi:hypothetical protein
MAWLSFVAPVAAVHLLLPGVLAALMRARVAGSEGCLVDVQGPLVQGQGLRGVAQFGQHPAHVVEVVGDVGVAGSEGCLADAQGPLVQGQGLRGAGQG